MLHSKVVMKGVGIGKINVFNTTLLICSLVLQLIHTDKAFTLNGRTHTHTHTHTNTHITNYMLKPFPQIHTEKSYHVSKNSNKNCFH